jgi:hypothetical protein
MKSLTTYITEKMVYTKATANTTDKTVKEFFNIIKKCYSDEIIFALCDINNIPKFKMNKDTYEVRSLMWYKGENYVTLENSKESYEVKLESENQILTFIPEEILNEIIIYCEHK